MSSDSEMKWLFRRYPARHRKSSTKSVYECSGCDPGQIARLFLHRVMTWTLMSPGTALSFGVTQLLRNQLYGVHPSDPRVFATSILILLIPVLLVALRPQCGPRT